jgi:hypothetical protein
LASLMDEGVVLAPGLAGAAAAVLLAAAVADGRADAVDTERESGVATFLAPSEMDARGLMLPTEDVGETTEDLVVTVASAAGLAAADLDIAVAEGGLALLVGTREDRRASDDAGDAALTGDLTAGLDGDALEGVTLRVAVPVADAPADGAREGRPAAGLPVPVMVGFAAEAALPVV